DRADALYGEARRGRPRAGGRDRVAHRAARALDSGDAAPVGLARAGVRPLRRAQREAVLPGTRRVHHVRAGRRDGHRGRLGRLDGAGDDGRHQSARLGARHDPGRLRARDRREHRARLRLAGERRARDRDLLLRAGSGVIARALELGPLVLASSSPRRRDILGLLGIEFTVVEPDYAEEDIANLDPAVLRAAPPGGRPDPVPGERVLGVDTLVALDGVVFQKPADADEARSFLRAL